MFIVWCCLWCCWGLAWCTVLCGGCGLVCIVVLCGVWCGGCDLVWLLCCVVYDVVLGQVCTAGLWCTL